MKNINVLYNMHILKLETSAFDFIYANNCLI